MNTTLKNAIRQRFRLLFSRVKMRLSLFMSLCFEVRMGFLAGPVVAAALFSDIWVYRVWVLSPRTSISTVMSRCTANTEEAPIVGGHQHCQQQRGCIGLLAGTWKQH